MAKRDEKTDIRNFGLFLTVLLAILGAVSFYRQGSAWPYLWGVAGYALITALLIKPALRPVFKGAMWVGLKINWFMTRLILTIFFIVLLTPLGIVMRIFRADLLGRKFDPNAETFWKPTRHPEYKPEYSERLF